MMMMPLYHDSYGHGRNSNLLLLDLMKCVLLPPLLLFGLWPVEYALGHLMRAAECIISHKSHKEYDQLLGQMLPPGFSSTTVLNRVS